MRFTLLLCLAALCLLSACAGLSDPGRPTLIPTEYLPTAIALTVQARGAAQAGPTLTVAPAAGTRRTPTPAAADTPAETSEPGDTQPPEEPEPETSPTSENTPTVQATATPRAPTGRPTATLAPPVPEGIVQIWQIGERSRITSPILVTTRLLSEWGKVVRIELYGEDGRLLARYLRTFTRIPWDNARVDVNLEFEISAAGEAGRLVVSVEDAYGRLIDVNSVNVILLSSGVTQLNPATALWQRLIIEEPRPNALIQGGILIVSGRALANHPDQPLRVMLVGEDGRILGHRLARINEPSPGNYGTFVAEVPYEVSELTAARLVVYEEGEPESDIAHLTSIEVVLAP